MSGYTKYKLVKYEWFNKQTAEMEHEYRLCELVGTWFGRERWRYAGYYVDMGIRLIYRGDLKWAKKIAKHYGIEVPK